MRQWILYSMHFTAETGKTTDINLLLYDVKQVYWRFQQDDLERYSSQ